MGRALGWGEEERASDFEAQGNKLTVLQMHLDGRPVGRFADPDVEVFAFACFEEHHIVAVVQLGELVELVQLGLRVELGIFPAVREERVEVIEEMSVAIGHTAGGEDENSLLGSAGYGVGRVIFGCGGLGK